MSKILLKPPFGVTKGAGAAYSVTVDPDGYARVEDRAIAAGLVAAGWTAQGTTAMISPDPAVTSAAFNGSTYVVSGGQAAIYSADVGAALSAGWSLAGSTASLGGGSSLPTDANGNILANVVPRTNTLSALQTVVMGQGELASVAGSDSATQSLLAQGGAIVQGYGASAPGGAVFYNTTPQSIVATGSGAVSVSIQPAAPIYAVSTPTGSAVTSVTVNLLPGMVQGQTVILLSASGSATIALGTSNVDTISGGATLNNGSSYALQWVGNAWRGLSQISGFSSSLLASGGFGIGSAIASGAYYGGGSAATMARNSSAGAIGSGSIAIGSASLALNGAITTGSNSLGHAASVYGDFDNSVALGTRAATSMTYASSRTPATGRAVITAATISPAPVAGAVNATGYTWTTTATASLLEINAPVRVINISSGRAFDGTVSAFTSGSSVTVLITNPGTLGTQDVLDLAACNQIVPVGVVPANVAFQNSISYNQRQFAFPGSRVDGASQGSVITLRYQAVVSGTATQVTTDGATRNAFTLPGNANSIILFAGRAYEVRVRVLANMTSGAAVGTLTQSFPVSNAAGTLNIGTGTTISAASFAGTGITALTIALAAGTTVATLNATELKISVTVTSTANTNLTAFVEMVECL